MRIPVDTLIQIELNQELARLHELEEKTAWNVTLVHVPKTEQKKKFLTCANGCCRWPIISY